MPLDDTVLLVSGEGDEEHVCDGGAVQEAADGGLRYRLVEACRAVKYITVEPILLVYWLGWTIQSTVSTNLLLDKVCYELRNNSVICSNLSAHEELQIEVQRQVTKINLYKSLMTSIPSVVFVLFIGPWSDKHGRKLPLLLPMLGSLLSTLVYMANAYWFSLPAMYILLTGVPQALTGSFAVLMMAAYSYIADITKLRSRTMRIAIMDFAMMLGAPAGLLISDYTFSSLGYFGIYGISASLFFIAIIYIIVRIEDTRGRFSRHHLEETELSSSSGGMCSDFFDVANVRNSFAVCFKPRRDKLRAKILLLMTAMCCLVFLYGVTDVGYLYVKRMFGWTYSQYVHLGLVEIAISIVANSCALPLLSYYLQVDDAILGLLGCISKIAKLLLTGLAIHPWFLYLAAVADLLGGIPWIVIRSSMSKMIPQAEIGTIFSMLASWESVLPLLSQPLGTFVYNATIEDFPGAVYVLGSAIVAGVSIIFVWLASNRGVSSPGEEAAGPGVQC